MPTKKPPTEKCSFSIKNDETLVSFDLKGSVVLGIVEAFTWLTPDRRENLLKRLQAKQAELLMKEAERAKQPTPATPF